jgi:hypothetical protein
VSASTGQVAEVDWPVPRWWHGLLREVTSNQPKTIGTWSPKFVGPVLLKYLYLRSSTQSAALDDAGLYLTYAPAPGPDYAVAGSPPPRVLGTPIEGWQLVRILGNLSAQRLDTPALLWPMNADEGGPQLRMDAWRIDYYIDAPTVSFGMHVRTTAFGGQHYWRLHFYERVSRDLLVDLLG